MSLEALKARIPDAARDLRINLGNVLASDHLTPAQAYGAALASAIAARNPEVVYALRAEAAAHLDATGLAAVETAAAVMAMNNVYYRFTHLVKDPEYATMTPRLRMQGIMNHGAPALDFELWSIAVSAVNGCGKCLDAHANAVTAKGGTKLMVQDAVRVAAVVSAVATTLGALPAPAVA